MPQALPRQTACSGTPVPKPGAAHTLEWIGIEYLADAVVAMFTDGLLSYILSAIAPTLINVDNLCASNPQVPALFTDEDFVTKLENTLQPLVPGAPLYTRLVEYMYYGAFQHFCDCPGTDTPPPFTPTGSCNNVQQLSCVPHGMGWDSASLGKTCTNGCTYVVNLDWLFSPVNTGRVFVWAASDQPVGWTRSCFPTDPFVQELHGTWTAVSGTCGPGYEFTPMQYGPFSSTTEQICALQSPDVPTQDILIMVSQPGDVYPGGTSPWGFSASASLLCGNPPPPQPPPATTFPPAPPRACDTATLCDISWVTNNYLTNATLTTFNTNNQVTNITIGSAPVTVAPITYQPGTSWSISGQGEQAVAPGTLALSVVITGWPPPLDPVPTDPPDFYNVGNIVTGNGEGWDIRRWVRRSPMRIWPTSQPFTRFAYNLAQGVTMTVTELV